MFSNKGFFNRIACPVGDDCDLINCLFLHEGIHLNGDAMELGSTAITEEPQAKRLKANPSTVDVKPSSSVAQPTPAFMGTLLTKKPQLAKPQVSQSQHDASNERAEIAPEKRPVSPPPPRRPQQPPQSNANRHGLPVKHSTEPLNPRMLSQAPAAHQTRMLYLKKLHEALTNLNEKAKTSADLKSLLLAPAQLTTLALDEEQKIAKDNFSVYANIVKLRLVAYKKMDLEAWKVHLLQMSEVGKSEERQGQRPTVNGERVLETGLSEAQERQVLTRLFAKLHGLEQYGYVTVANAPNGSEVKQAKRGDELEDGWEKCCRCQTRFQVFPDRRSEDGALTAGGTCIYHPGRIIAGGRARETIYGCCNDVVGRSVGCTDHPCHVYKIDSLPRLAALWQFVSTPDNPEVGHDQAVSLDCEMGYTVYGFELIRLTVLTWPKGNKILDVLVRPFGALLDLNTRFSGVTPEQFKDVVPYTPSAPASTDTLQIVSSPAEARRLLFKLINPSTPVVGHGLDNDLSVLRVIHPCIVDTALLCPHARGLPYRRALKQLARDYLFRIIQDAAGHAGHDSAEDAKAAGDIALELVKRKWWKMKNEGWKADDGKLVPPKIISVQQSAGGELHDQEAASLQAQQASRMEDLRDLQEKSGRKRGRQDDEDVVVELNYD